MDERSQAVVMTIDGKTRGNRAAIYARVSDKSQDTEDKTSLSEQIADMEAYCERMGLIIAARYQEVGRSWSKKRPEFQRMLADASDARFDVIVCWKMDRLSRGMYPAAALMEVVEAHQMRLESVLDPIDMKMFGILAAIGKIELDNIRERTSMGRRGKAKQGRMPNGSVPYGYRTGEDGRPVVYEPEAEIVQRIFHLYVHEGMVGLEIARQLARDNAPTWRPGSRWQNSYVHTLLGKEVYKGTWWYGKARWIATEGRDRVIRQPEDTWIGVPFPPLVDEQTWDRAQAIKKYRTSLSKRNTKVFYLLQRLVRCAECGLLFACRSKTRTTVKRKDKTYSYNFKTPQRHYHCYGMQREHLRCRQRPYIRADRLEELVWREVKTVVQNPDLIVEGMESLGERGDGGLAKRIAGAERDLRKVQAEEDRAISLFVSGKITEGQLDQQRKPIQERLKDARAKLDDYRVQETMAIEKQVLMSNVAEWAVKVGDGLDGLPPEERREVLRLIVDQIAIDRDNNVTITLGIPTQEFVSIEKEGSRTTRAGGPWVVRPCHADRRGHA